MRRLKNIVDLFRQTFDEWTTDNVPRLGAALAFYAVFSIAPLLILTIELAGWLFGPQAVRGELEASLAGLVGPAAAAAVQSIVVEASGENDLTLLGALMLVIGASGVLAQFRETMNIVWNVTPVREGVMRFLVNRGLAVIIVPFCAILFILLAAATAVISTLGSRLDHQGGAVLWQALDLVGSFAILTVVFTLILRIAPAVSVPWRTVAAGGALTAFLFVAGKSALSFYIASGSTASAYGAAGSLVVILLWIFYSAQIVFFGAEFTQVLCRRREKAGREDAESELPAEETSRHGCRSERQNGEIVIE